MQNKWFVGGLILPAVVFSWATVSCLRHDMGIFAIVPGAIAIGLYYGAYKVSRANSFTSKPQVRFDSGTSEAVERWNRDRDERDAAAKKAAHAGTKI